MSPLLKYIIVGRVIFMSVGDIHVFHLAALQEVSGRVVPWQPSFNDFLRHTGEDVWFNKSEGGKYRIKWTTHAGYCDSQTLTEKMWDFTRRFPSPLSSIEFLSYGQLFEMPLRLQLCDSSGGKRTVAKSC